MMSQGRRNRGSIVGHVFSTAIALSTTIGSTWEVAEPLLHQFLTLPCTCTRIFLCQPFRFVLSLYKCDRFLESSMFSILGLFKPIVLYYDSRRGPEQGLWMVKRARSSSRPVFHLHRVLSYLCFSTGLVVLG